MNRLIHRYTQRTMSASSFALMTNKLAPAVAPMRVLASRPVISAVRVMPAAALVATAVVLGSAMSAPIGSVPQLDGAAGSALCVYRQPHRSTHGQQRAVIGQAGVGVQHGFGYAFGVAVVSIANCVHGIALAGDCCIEVNGRHINS